MKIERTKDVEGIAGLYELLEESDVFHMETLPDIFRKSNRDERIEQLKRFTDKNDVMWFVAREGEKLAGALMAHFIALPEMPLVVQRKYVYVGDLSVSRDFRRRGIGKKLMEEVRAWAVEKDAGKIELMVWEFNAGAREFYEALGYKTLYRGMSIDVK